MFLAVWTLYAADRLLDAHPLHRHPTSAAELEHRHLFHHRYGSRFLAGIVVACLGLAVLLPHLDPRAIRLDLVLGALLVAYFVLIHAASGPRLPKEIAVGLFFSAAIFIPSVAREPFSALHTSLLPAALLFAALCCLNCLSIYAWEHASPAAARPHRLTRAAVRHLRPLATLLIGLAVAFTLATRQPAGVAVTLSALCLLLLDRYHHRFAPLTLRAVADLALATPLLLCLHLRR